MEYRYTNEITQPRELTLEELRISCYPGDMELFDVDIQRLKAALRFTGLAALVFLCLAIVMDTCGCAPIPTESHESMGIVRKSYTVTLTYHGPAKCTLLSPETYTISDTDDGAIVKVHDDSFGYRTDVEGRREPNGVVTWYEVEQDQDSSGCYVQLSWEYTLDPNGTGVLTYTGAATDASVCPEVHPIRCDYMLAAQP